MNLGYMMNKPFKSMERLSTLASRAFVRNVLYRNRAKGYQISRTMAALIAPRNRSISSSASQESQSLGYESFANIIDGKSRHATGGIFFQGKSPETGDLLWRVPKGTVQDVDDAVNAGKKAFVDWAGMSLKERAERVKLLAQALQEEKEEFMALLMAETADRKTATLKLPDFVYKGDGFTAVTQCVPYGVTAAICPWNSTSKLAPSIIAGNTISMKPSPFTPYSLLKLVELAQRFFPPGVLQCIGGGDEIGPALVDHPGIAKISFTGSSKTGKAIMASCAKNVKPVSLELGGNDPSIVFPDVDIQSTAVEVAKGAFYNSGQICVGTKRIFVHADIYDHFLAAFVSATRSMTVGPSRADTTILGPIQNELQYKTVQSFVDDSVKHGHRFALNGPQSGLPQEPAGFFMLPVVLDNPPDDARIVREEQFGPIVPVQKWTHLEEVIRRANDSDTGLGACLWTKDLDFAKSVAKRLEVGTVWINSHGKLRNEVAFSGWKESGLGGELGPLALTSWVHPKVIHTYD